MDKIEHIKKEGDALFSGRERLMSFWQEVAENFYPERAQFTAPREPGDDFASQLETSYPILARRDLGNQIGGMLRPSNKEWFKIVKRYDDNLDTDAKQWLEWAAKIQKRAMYDPVAMFTRAAKEADQDWATFGQAPMSVRINLKENALLYRTWHLKDVAWKEDYIGRIGTVYRKWRPDALTLKHYFPETIHPKVTEKLSKKPFDEIDVYHCEVPSEFYGDGEFSKWPMVSIYYDCANHHIMEEVGIWEGEYIIPRWQTMSGSQYAFSPATVAALPEARLLQAIAGILLDASEKAIDPPKVAVKEAIRGDISIYAGGITWVDSEYDERLGEVLRELKSEGNLPVGFEMTSDVRATIAEACYLNKLALPPPEPGMTAYEASERVAEYIRQALPLFEPMEDEYNGGICEKTFNLLMKAGGFGDPRNMPRSLYGGDIGFQFVSPLRESVDKLKGQKFIETTEMIQAGSQFDPTVAYLINISEALRDVFDGIDSPAKWRRSKQEVLTIQSQIKDMQESAQALQEGQQISDIAKTANEAMSG